MVKLNKQKIYFFLISTIPILTFFLIINLNGWGIISDPLPEIFKSGKSAPQSHLEAISDAYTSLREIVFSGLVGSFVIVGYALKDNFSPQVKTNHFHLLLLAVYFSASVGCFYFLYMSSFGVLVQVYYNEADFFRIQDTISYSALCLLISGLTAMAIVASVIFEYSDGDDEKA
jgi:hypothetical protein